MIRYTLIGGMLLAILATSHTASAQFDYKFFMPPIWQTGNNPQNDPSQLFITSPFDNVSVHIQTPDGTTFVFDGVVSSGTPLVVPLTPAIGQTVLPNTVMFNNGLIIEASMPIMAAHRVMANTSQSLVTLKGQDALGHEFYCASQTRNRLINNNPTSRHFISVMATEDNTEITFETPFDMYTPLAGDLPNPYTITLNAYESYCIIGNTTAQHVAGSRVTSDKHIAVISGSAYTPTPASNGNNGADSGIDQVLPIQFAGTEYAMIRGNNSGTLDYAIIVGTVDGTNIYIDGNPVPAFTVNQSSYVDWTLTGAPGTPHYIQADNPIMLYQVSGASADDEVDMAIIPAITCTGSRYLELSLFPDNVNQYMQLLVSDEADPNLTINGTLYSTLPGVVTTPIPGLTGWKAASIPENVLSTNSVLQANGLFHAAWLAGTEVNGAYGFFSKFNTAFDFLDPETGIPTPIYYLGALCAGESMDHCVEVLSCGTDHEISNVYGNIGQVDIAPPTSPYDSCFRYTAPFGFTGYDTLNLVFSNNLGFEGTLEVVFLALDPNTPINAGPDQTLCVTNSTTLSAINPDIYVDGYWTLVSGSGTIANPNSPTTTVTNLGPGTNVFAWHQDYPCGVNNVDQVNIYNFSGALPQSNAGPDASLCGSGNYTMQANSAGSTGVGTWEISCGQATIVNANSPTTLVTNIAIGVNCFQWHIDNGGCPGDGSMDEMVIYVFDPNHPAANAGPDQSLCSSVGVSTLLTANTPIVPATGQWTLISGTGTFANATSPSTTVSGLSIGQNIFQWTINNGPCGTLTDQVIITVFNGTSPAANAGPDQTLCLPNNSVTMAGNAPISPATGTWTVVNGSGSFANAGSPTTTVTGLSLGTNTFRWTLNNGPCPGAITFDDIVVTVYPASQPAANAGPDQSLCYTGSPVSTNMAGSSVTAPGVGTWTVISGTGTFSNANSPTTLVSGLSLGVNVFQWIVTNGGCTPTQNDQMSITVFSGDTPAPTAGPDASLCTPNTSYTMQGSAIAAPATGIWTLISGSGSIVNPSSPTTQVTNLGIGVNTFRWSVNNGPCAGSLFDEVSITVFSSNAPAANAGPDQEVCFPVAGQLIVNLAGNTPLAPATGTWTLVSGAGTVTNPNSPTSGISGLQIGTNVFQWTINNGSCGTTSDQVTIYVFSPAQTAANAGADQELCSTSNTTSVTANALIAPATGTWSVVSGTATIVSPNSVTTQVNGLGIGTNVLQWTIDNGPCATPASLTDQVTITVFNNNQAAANAGPDQSICSTTTSVVMAANTAVFPASGQWTVVQGTGTFANAASPVTTVTGMSVGTNIYQWTISNGPCGSTSDQVTVTVFSSANPVANAGPDQELCLPQTSATLTGSSLTFPATGTWTVIDGTGTFSNASTSTTTVSGLSVGVNTFQWSVNNGPCGGTTTDQVTIVVFDNVQDPANAGPDASFCTPTSTYVMQATAVPFPAEGVWTVVQGTGSFSDANDPNATVSNLTVGTNIFRWTILNGPCGGPSNFDEVSIFIYSANQPSANAGPDQELCQTGAGLVSATMSGSSVIAPGSGLWTLVSGSGTIVSPSSPTTQITNLAVGTNIFQWTVNNGPCNPSSTSDQVVIYVFSSTQTAAAAGADQQLCSSSNSTTVNANPLISPATGVWTVTNGTATIASPNSPSTAVTGLGLGTNVLQWTIDNGPCASPATLSDQLIITVFNSNQAAANAGPDQSICNFTSSVTMAANSAIFPATGQWTVVQGTGTFANSGSPVTTVTGMSVGVNIYQWTISNGPCGNTSDQVSVTVFSTSNPVANAGTDQEICLPQTSASLSGSSLIFPATGVWTVVAGTGTFSNATSPSTTVSGLSVGVNTFQWTVNNGPCNNPTSDQVTIVVFDNDQDAANAGPDASYCTPVSGHVMQANAVSLPAVGVWSVTQGTGSFSNINDPFATVTNLSIGVNIFRWTILNGPCPGATNFDEVSIFVYDANQPVANAGSDQELCQTGVTLVSTTMAGSSVTVPGSGVWTLVSGTGTIVSPSSPTTQITNLAVGTNIFQWTVSNGPCNPSVSNDQVVIYVFSNNQTAANAGPDQELCSSNASTVLAGSSLISPATGLWTVVSGSAVFADATNPLTSVSGLATGVNVLQWTIDNGPCANPASLSDQVVITVYSQFQPAANAGTDIQICRDNPSTTLLGNAPVFPATGSWSLISGSGTIASPTSAITNVSGLGVGANVFQWTIDNGPCSALLTDQVTVFVFDDNHPAAFAGNDQFLCLPQTSSVLTGSTPIFPATGQWTLVSGTGTIANPTSPNSSVTGLSVGQNVFRWTINNGPCSPTILIDEVSIFVYSNVQPAANAGVDQSFCEPISSTTLQGNSVIFPATGQWTLVSGTGTIANPSNPNSSVTGLTVGENIFRWTITNGPCVPGSTFDEVSIFIYDDSQQAANAGPDQSFCTPVSSTTLQANGVTFPATGQWTLVSGTAVIADPTNPNTLVSGLTVGEHILRWTISNGPCANSLTTDEVSIFIYQTNAPAATAGADYSMCTPESTYIMNGNAPIFPASGQWTLVSGTGVIVDPSDPNTQITNLGIGVNTFQWTIDNGGCAPSITSDQMSIYVYSVESPDADAGEHIDLCLPDNSTTLSGSSFIFPAYGEWTLVSGTGTIVDPSDPNTAVTGLAVGINVFQWTVYNGPCANAITSDQVAVYVFDSGGLVSEAGPNQELCSPTSTTTMAADPAIFPGTGTWTLISGSGVAVNPNDPNTQITGLAIGENIFRWTVDYEVCGFGFDDVTITVFDSSQGASDAGADQEFCAPVSSSVLTADPVIYPGYGTWSVIEGSSTVINVNDPASAVENLSIGNNILVWTIYNGSCLAPELTTDTVNIIIYDNTQEDAFAGLDQFICTPQASVVMNANEADYPASGSWSIIQGSAFIANPSSPLSAVGGLGVGETILQWTIDNGVCGEPTTDQVSIFVYDQNNPVADAGQDQSFCSTTTTTTLDGSNIIFPAVGVWTVLQGSAVVTDPNDPNSGVTNLTVGEHVLQWSVNNGPCGPITTSVMSIFVFDVAQPAADAGDDQELCLPQTSTSFTGNAVTYPANGVWTLVSGTGNIANPSDPQSAVSGLSQGINVFVWTISNGPCPGSLTTDTVEIRVYNPDAIPAFAGDDQDFCEPVSSTNMTATTPEIPGVGTWTLLSGSGVIADVNDPNTLITGLSVGENIFRWSVYNGPCTSPEMVDFVSIFIFESSQTPASAGPDQELCTPFTLTSMNANTVIFPASGTWSLVSGSGNIVSPGSAATFVTNLGIGNNQFMWTIDNGPCTPAVTTDIVNIAVFDQFAAAANAGPDQEICLPQTSTTLTGSALSGAMTGVWNVIGGSGTFASPTSSSTMVSGLTQGINMFTWTVDNGPCGTTTDTTVVYLFNPNAAEAYAGEDVAFCTPVSTYILQAQTPDVPGVGTWALVSGTATFNDVNDPNAEVSGLTVGENILSWTVYNGPCEEPTTDLISVFIFDVNAEPADAGDDTEMCLPSNSYVMQGNEPVFPAIGTWTLIQGTATIVSPNDPSSLVVNIGVGENIFVWTIDNGICENGVTSDTVSVFVFDDEAPVANAGVDQFICEPDLDAVMTATTPAVPGTGTWQLLTGCGVIADVNDPNSLITGLCVGENIFSWTVYNGPCDVTNTVDYVSIYVYDNDQPSADAGEDQELCTPLTTAQMSANSPIFPATGTWSLISGSANISDVNDPQALITNAAPGVNVFVWTINNGPCPGAITTDTVTISVFLNDLPPADAGEDQEICLPQNSVVLDGSNLGGAATGLWTLVSGGGLILNPTSDVTTVIALPVGTNVFTWSVDNGPCGSSVDTVVVYVFDPLADVADAGPDVSYCTPVSVHTLSANTPDIPGVGTWTSTPPGLIAEADIHNPNATASGLQVGESVFVWTIDNGPCDEPSSDEVSVFIYDANAEPADAGDDAEMCLPSNSYVMQGNDPVFPAVGTWTLIQGSATIVNANSPSSLILNLAVGENIFVWTINNGPCPDAITTDTVSVFVFDDEAPVANAGVDQFICEPDLDAVMTATTPAVPGTGTWQLLTGCGVIADVNDPNSLITGLCVGENIFSWTVYNGPCDVTNTVDYVSIYVYDNDQPSADAGDDQELCTPLTTAQMSANSPIFPATGTWSLISGSANISDVNDPQALITNAAPGVSVFVWTINNGPCPGAITTDTVTISVFLNDLPPADAGDDQEICLPQNSVVLDGSNLGGAATGLWTLVSGGGLILTPTSDVTTVIALPVGTNVFTWSVDNGPCGSSVDTVVVYVFDPLADVADAGPDASYCSPASTHTLNANTPNAPGVGTWTSSPPGLIAPQDINNPNATATGLQVGESVFVWSIDNGPCDEPTTDVMSVFIYDQFAPDAYAGEDQEICLPQNVVQMNALPATFPAVGTWTLIDGSGIILDVNDPNSVIVGLNLGTNCFVWTVDNGPCQNGITADTVCIHVFQENIVLPDAGPDQDICTPQSTVQMAGNAASEPGYGYWTLINGTATIEDENDPLTMINDLAVGINVFTWTFYNGPCDNALPTDTVIINVFDANQLPADAGPDQEICLPLSTVQMAANTPTPPAIGTWTLLAGQGIIGNVNDPNTLVTGLAEGTNCFVWKIENGPCPDAVTTDTMYVFVFSEDAAIADAGFDIEICTPQDCVVMGAAEPEDPTYGTWTVISGSASIADVNDPNTAVCNLTVGETILAWTVYNGPCEQGETTDIVSIFVFDAQNLPADAGDDTELCSPEDTYVLQGSPLIFPATGLWTISGPGTIDDPANPNATVSGLQIGSSTLTWTVSNGPCGDPTSDSMTITIFDPNSPDADAGEDMALCEDYPTITLDGNQPIAPAFGTWTLISGEGEITDPNDPNTTVTNVGYVDNVFVWTIYNGPCANGTTTDTMVVFVNSPTISAADAGNDSYHCGPPESLTLNGSVTLLSGTSLWTIVAGGGTIDDPTNNNPTLTDIPIGVNTYLYTVDNGECGITSDEVSVYVYDPDHPIVDAGPPVTICEHEFTPFNLNGTVPIPPAISYWEVGSGPGELSDPENPDALVISLGEIIVPLEDVVTTFIYTIDNGVCGKMSDTVTYILEDCLTIEVPDAFSPNGDGVNDEFVINNLDQYPNNRIEIYNRWGALIYDAAPYQNNWDGRSEHPATIGEELPVSTYYYILDLGTGEEALRGFIYLKR